MKKQVIAAAVAAAFAVPAVAQVSLSGTIDLSYDAGKGNSDAKTLASGLMSTSALNMSGSEDLGGGMKAFFDINTGIGNALNSDGTTYASSTSFAAGSGISASQGGLLQFGDRGARVGISGGFGSIAIGKSTGTVINDLRGGVLGNVSLLAAGGGSFGDDSDRPKDSIQYTSPAISGVTIGAIMQTSTRDYELSARYAAGPLTIGVAGQSDRGTSKNDVGARVGYNFGVAAVNFSYQNIRSGTTASDETNTNGTYTSIGITVPVGSNIQVMAEGQSRADSVGKASSVGAVYTLSKRTNAYVVYSKNQRSTSDTATTTNDYEANALMAIGLRHSF